VENTFTIPKVAIMGFVGISLSGAGVRCQGSGKDSRARRSGGLPAAACLLQAGQGLAGYFTPPWGGNDRSPRSENVAAATPWLPTSAHGGKEGHTTEGTARQSRNQSVARAGTSVICEARALVLEVIPAKLVPAKAESGNPVSKPMELRSRRTGFPRPAGGMTDLPIPVVSQVPPLSTGGPVPNF
jgi:hypothetical protein